MLFLGILFVTLSNILYIFPAQVTSMAIDLVVESLKNMQYFEGMDYKTRFFKNLSFALFLFGVLYIVFALLKGFFTYLTRQTIIVMSRHVEFDLKNDIYNHYQKLPLSFYRSHNTGDLMNRISEDVSKVRMYVGPAWMYGLNLIVLFVIVIPYMFSVNMKLALYTLLPLPVLSISIYFVSNHINKLSEQIQAKLSGLSTFVQEAFSGIRVIKAFAKEKQSTSEFDVLSEDYKNESLKLAKVNAYFFPIISTMIGLSTIITVYVGGSEFIKGNVSIGNIAEFIIYVNILTWPVTSLGWITSLVQQAAASQSRINEFLDTKSNILDGDKKLDIRGKITFENVGLVYPESNIEALKNLNFSIFPGETLAILGKTGSGKSSLANLLCRLIDPNSGKILIDDIDIKNLNLDYLRNQMGYVPQESFLFSDTIKNNILFGNQSLTENNMLQATKDADVYSNIMNFPNKFETILGERGITLSGGQKQRVTIARAIIRNPKILIFDDCLSAVDTQTEDRILNSLSKLMANRTSILISHRASTVKLADRILVLDKGEVAEIGTHEELYSLNGLYKELYDAQLEEIS